MRRLPSGFVALRWVGACLLVFLALSSGAHAFLRAAPGTNPDAATSSAPDRVTKDARASQQNQARQAVDRIDHYDPANPDHSRLQRIEDATRHLPHDTNGFPDWMRALRERKIALRYDVMGKSAPELLDLDIIMRNTKEMPAVRFPHLAHTMWLSCSNCHPAPFRAEKGSNTIRMGDIFRGQYCGMCHDRVAFITFYSCTRCHSEPAGTNAASK